MTKKVAVSLGFLGLALLAYLLFWPVVVVPVSWVAPKDPGYVGAFAVNHRLAGLQHIALGNDKGPEHVTIGRDGKLYVAVASGNILRVNADGSGREVFVNTGGRPLGLAFDANNHLIVADAFRGLMRVERDRQVTLLTDRVDGTPILFADAVVIADRGMVYFTDASRRFGAKQWGPYEASFLDTIEQSATGRVLEYDPTTHTTRVVARGLSFANGIVISEDQRSLLVAETARYRVWRIAVDAADVDVSTLPKGDALAHHLLDNLPGYPDNLARGLDGRIWMGLVKPRSAAADGLAGLPFLRAIGLRLPHALLPVPKAYGHMVAFTEDGKVVASLQDPSGAYPDATGITETRDRLYVQNLNAKTLAWLTPQAAGL